jgi:Fe-S-cluster containining protein
VTDTPPSASNQPAPDAASSSQAWYADGLRFECTSCGNCCTGPPGWVWFTPEEGKAMAKKLGIDEPTFYERYARKVRRRYSLEERKTEHGFDCIFLDRTTVPGKALCGVYDARPAQCRTWPFWPENIKTPRRWAAAKKHTPCPGMDTGPVIPVEQIHIQRDATPKG